MIDEMSHRTVDDEVRRFEAANTGLRAEVADLRQELASLRESKRKPKPALRSSKSAAVTITVLTGESITLAEAMAEARSTIVLRDLGIETVVEGSWP